MRRDAHVGPHLVGKGVLEHLHALVGREQRTSLVGIEGDDHDQLVENSQCIFDNLKMGHGRWVEHARVNGQAGRVVRHFGAMHRSIQSRPRVNATLIAAFVARLRNANLYSPPHTLKLRAKMSLINHTTLSGGDAA